MLRLRLYEDEYDDSFDDLPPPPPNATEKLEEDADDPEESKLGEEKMFWYFEGRVYNAPKQGAKVIKARSPMEASHIAATQIESEKTFGLGEGGNKAVFPRQDTSVSGVDYQQRRHHQKKEEEEKLRAAAQTNRGPGSNAPSFQERNRRKAASSRKRDVL